MSASDKLLHTSVRKYFYCEPTLCVVNCLFNHLVVLISNLTISPPARWSLAESCYHNILGSL